MGIYIEGMKMPKSCCACPLFKSNMSKQLFCKAFGAFDKSDYDKLPIERMKNCPLVPVPPHGRLIDADAYEQLLYSLGNRDYRREKGSIKDAIKFLHSNYAPTIIPAEEGET